MAQLIREQKLNNGRTYRATIEPHYAGENVRKNRNCHTFIATVGQRGGVQSIATVFGADELKRKIEWHETILRDLREAKKHQDAWIENGTVPDLPDA